MSSNLITRSQRRKLIGAMLVIMLTIPAFIPLPEAVRKYGLDEALIRALIERGRIKAAMINDQIFIPELTAQTQVPQPLCKEDLPEYKMYAHLKGVPIWISAASRKYGITFQTISLWAQRGLIKVLGYDKNRKLIDEADMAYCAEIHRHHKGAGKWVFDKDGLPYEPKNKPREKPKRLLVIA